MRKINLMKQLLLLLMLSSLLFAVPMALAQDEAEASAATEEVAEAGGSPLDPLGINAGLLAVQIFNFLILLLIVRAVLWKPAVNMLDARSAKIQKGLEDAAAAAKARQNAEAEAEKILSEARSESAREIAAARSRGEDLTKQLQAEARSSAEKIRKDAEEEAAAARDAELAGLRDQVLDISVAVASRIIGESIDAKKQKALVSDFFSKVPADAKGLSGSVEVVSAMPLDDAEQEKARKEIGADSVTFKVDPAILGGLIIRSQDRVIDGSVRSNLSALAERLN